MADSDKIGPRVRCFSIRELTAAGLGSKSDIYRKIAAGTFPAPFRIGGKVLWRESTIIAFLDKISGK